MTLFRGIKAIMVLEEAPTNWIWNNGERKNTSGGPSILDVTRADGVLEKIQMDNNGVWFRDGDWIVAANP